MLQANIIDNKIYCQNNHHNYKVKDYKEIKIRGEKYIKFIARCQECGEIFYYFSRITMNDTKYFMFSENEEIEVKEDEEKENIKNE